MPQTPQTSVYFPQIRMPQLASQRQQTEASSQPPPVDRVAPLQQQQTSRTPLDTTRNLIVTRESVRAVDAGKPESSPGNLFTQLQHEAEKVRKWKVQMEIEMKQKNSQLDECQKQLQVIQKSALELQLKNESLNMKLQDESEVKENLVKRVNATREMCYALKSSLDRIVEQMQRCEKEKDILQCKAAVAAENLQYFDNKLTSFEQQLNEATEKYSTALAEQKTMYESLNAGYLHNIADLEQKRADTETEIVCLKNEKALLQALIANYEQEVVHLKAEADENGRQLTEVRDELNGTQRQVLNSQESLSITCTQLETCKAECLIRSVELDEKRQEIESILTERAKLHSELQTTIDSLRFALDERLKEAAEQRQTIDSFQSEIQLKSERISALEAELGNLLPRLHESQETTDSLRTKLACLEERTRSLEQQLDFEESEKEERSQRLAAAEVEKSATDAELKTVKTLYDQLLTECEQLKNELQATMSVANVTREKLEAVEEGLANLQRENASLQDTVSTDAADISSKTGAIELLNKQLAEKEDNEKCLRANVDTLQDTLKALRHENDLKDGTIASLSSELQHHKKTVHDNMERLSQMTESLQNAKIRGTSIELELQGEKFSRRMLEEQLEKLRLDMTQAAQRSTEMVYQEREKNEELHSKVNSLACDVTRLQIECRSAQDSLQSSTRDCATLKSQVETLQQALNSQETECRRLTQEAALLQVQLEQMRQCERSSSDKLEHTTAELKTESELHRTAVQEACRLRGEVVEAQRQCAELSSNVELQRQEMIATMENYKVENEKVVVRKDKEIETLTTKLDALTAKRDRETKLAKERLEKAAEELEGTKASLNSALDAKDKLATAYAERTSEIERLSKVIEAKEKDYSELLHAVQSIKTRATVVAAPAAKRQEVQANSEAGQSQAIPDVAASNQAPKRQPLPRQGTAPATPENSRPAFATSPKSLLRPTPALSLSRKRQMDVAPNVRAEPREVQADEHAQPPSPQSDVSHEFEVHELGIDKTINKADRAKPQKLAHLVATSTPRRAATTPLQSGGTKAGTAARHSKAEDNLSDDECLPRSRMLCRRSVDEKAAEATRTPAAAGKFFKSRTTPTASRFAAVKPSAASTAASRSRAVGAGGVGDSAAAVKKGKDSSFDIDAVFGFGQVP